MPRAINVEACFQKFNDTFAPKIVAELNGQHVKLARLEGDKVPWHTHDHEDELAFKHACMGTFIFEVRDFPAG